MNKSKLEEQSQVADFISYLSLLEYNQSQSNYSNLSQLQEIARLAGIPETIIQRCQADAIKYLELGKKAHKKSDWDDAIGNLEQSIVLNPDKKEAFHLLSEAYSSHWKKSHQEHDVKKLDQIVLMGSILHPEESPILTRIKKNLLEQIKAKEKKDQRLEKLKAKEKKDQRLEKLKFISFAFLLFLIVPGITSLLFLQTKYSDPLLSLLGLTRLPSREELIQILEVAENQLEDTENQLEDTENQLEDTENQLEDTETEVSTLNENWKESQEENTELSQTIDRLESRIESLSTKVEEGKNSPQATEQRAEGSACGDTSSASKTWYPVFVDNIDLSKLRKRCKDAFPNNRDDDTPSVQIASFTNRQRAQNFANEVGGEVGEATVRRE